MPERKRNIIGNEFIAVYEREAARMALKDLCGQGTIYPDDRSLEVLSMPR